MVEKINQSGCAYNIPRGAVPVRYDAQADGSSLQLQQHFLYPVEGQPIVIDIVFYRFPAAVKFAQVDTQSQVIIRYTKISGHEYFPGLQEKTRIFPHKPFVRQMEFFFDIRQRDIDAEFPQRFLIRGFPLHVEQGVTDIEPNKRYFQILPSDT